MKRLVAFLMLVMVIPLTGDIARAQIRTTLTSVSLSSVGNSVVTIRCVFSPYTPIFKIVPTDLSEAFTVTFEDTTKLNFSMPAPNGPMRAITAGSGSDGTTISVRLSGKASIRVLRDNQSLNIEFTVDGGQIASSTSEAGAPRVPDSASAFRVVQLKYADVSEIAGILGPDSAQIAPADSFSPNTVFGSPTFSQGGSGVPTLQAPSSVSITGQDQGHAAYGQRIDASLSIDRRLNAIILFGSDEEVARMAAMIEALDIPSKSVTFEAQIVELTDTAATNVGILLSNGTAAASGTFTAQSFASPQATLALQASILAQIQKGNGRLLATPRIQTTSGTSASILTGDALPLLTSLTIPGSPPVVQQQVQYVNVGVHLQILPRVSLDGNVTSHIVSEVSSVTGFIQGNIPEVSQRQAVATATVHDGEAYVIGGLIQDNELRNITKLPILGDIPFIGHFFSAVQNSTQRTNLYIIVTPHVSP